MILYLAQNPYCIIEPFLAWLLLLYLLLFTSPSLPGRGSFACLAAYSTSSQQPYRTSPENTRTQRNPEPHSTFPFKPAAREMYSIDHDLKNVSDITSLRVRGDVVSVSVWNGAGLDLSWWRWFSKRFQLEVKQSWPCSECSQCFPPFLFILIIIWLLEFCQSTLTQKYRNKGLGCTFVRTSVGARGPHLTHTYEQMHPLYSGLLTPRAKASYKKTTFGCIRRRICSQSWQNRSPRLSASSSVEGMSSNLCVCSKKQKKTNKKKSALGCCNPHFSVSSVLGVRLCVRTLPVRTAATVALYGVSRHSGHSECPLASFRTATVQRSWLCL